MTSRPITTRLAGLALAAGALLLVAACSSTAATAAPGTTAAPSTAAVPGSSLPSENKGLEALLPATLCGQPTTKTSLSGATFAAAATPVFTAMLSQLGKTPTDVNLAFASADATKAPNCGVTVGVFQISGANKDALKTVFLAASLQDETTYTESNVGGKDVFLDTSSSNKSYAYFKDDGVFFVEAPDDATAATVLAVMP